MPMSLESRPRDLDCNINLDNSAEPSPDHEHVNNCLSLNILSLDDKKKEVKQCGMFEEDILCEITELKEVYPLQRKPENEKGARSQHGALNSPGAMVGSLEKEELLGCLKIEILEEHRELLCKTLIPERFFPFLRSMSVLTLEDVEQIRHQVTTSGKVDMFLDVLIKKGPSSFDRLCEAILAYNDRGWVTTVLRKLNQALERRRVDILGLPSFQGDEGPTEDELPAPGRPGGPEVPK